MSIFTVQKLNIRLNVIGDGWQSVSFNEHQWCLYLLLEYSARYSIKYSNSKLLDGGSPSKANSAGHFSVDRHNEYQTKMCSKQAHNAMHHSMVSYSIRWCLKATENYGV